MEKANKQTNSANIQTMSAQSTSEIYSTPSGREAIIYGDDNYDYYVVGSSSSRNQTFTITRSDINGKNQLRIVAASCWYGNEIKVARL